MRYGVWIALQKAIRKLSRNGHISEQSWYQLGVSQIRGDVMDRLEFIYQGLNTITDGPQDPVDQYLLAIAIRREIESVGPLSLARMAEIDMFHTKALAV